MNKFIIRGRILSFNRAPTSLNDDESYYYNEDGALIINNGLIEDIGNFIELKKRGILKY